MTGEWGRGGPGQGEGAVGGCTPFAQNEEAFEEIFMKPRGFTCTMRSSYAINTIILIIVIYIYIYIAVSTTNIITVILLANS